MTLFMASAWPLVYGCSTELVRWRIPTCL